MARQDGIAVVDPGRGVNSAEPSNWRGRCVEAHVRGAPCGHAGANEHAGDEAQVGPNGAGVGASTPGPGCHVDVGANVSISTAVPLGGTLQPMPPVAGGRVGTALRPLP